MNSKPHQRMTSLGRSLFALKQTRADLEEKLSQVNMQISQIAEKDLANIMANADIEKFTIEGLGTIYMKDVVYASVLKENREKLYEWLRKNKHRKLIVPWVWPQTLTAFVKEQMEKGNPIPDDIIKVATVPTASTRSSGE